MNDLAARKRLLVAQAGLHRQLLELEGRRVLQRVDRARDFVHRNRWWLLGGAVAGGVLLAPKRRGFLEMLPRIPELLRLFRR